jgi:hypothetical protein
MILTPHIASGDHVDSIVTYYYDGDPVRSGRLFDIQRISRVNPGSTYLDAVPFTPTTCGQHQIFVHSLAMDGSASVSSATVTFKVTDDPVASINELIYYINQPSYPPRYRSSMLTYLNIAKQSFMNKQTQAGMIQMQVLLNLVQGGAFFVAV